MKRRIQIFMAVVAVAMGTATAALAYTHSGPFYDSAYNPQVWNYGIAVGNVSPTSPADSLTIPAGLISGFEESALRDLGTCLECETWTPAPGALAWIGTDSYGSLKLTTGVSTRFFTISANLGTPVVNTQLQTEGICGIPMEFSSSSTGLSPGQGPACMGSVASNGITASPFSIGLPVGVTSGDYAVLAFQWKSACGVTMGGSGAASTDIVADPADASGSATAAKVTCMGAIWNQYNSWGGVHSGTFQIGSLNYHVDHLSTSDCKLMETAAGYGLSGTTSGAGCYIAYALRGDLQTTLEHALPVPWVSQTALVSRSLSPAVTTSPNPTYLSQLRAFIDENSQSYTDEWNCLLNPAYVACPTSVPPPPFPPGCFNAPEPNVNESFNDYKLRIQNDGYTGTIVETTDPNYPAGGTGYPDNSPAAVLAVGVATGVGSMSSGGVVTMAYVASTGARVPAISWRGTIICPTTTTEVDIYDVPASGTGGTGGGSNSLPAVDFSPITSVSYGSAFPFGMFTWLNGLFVDAACNPAPYGGCNDAPTFTITKPGGGSLFVDLGSPTWVSTWRSPVFDVLDFLMVAGAVWFIAMRVIGIGGGSGGDEE